MVPFQNCVRQRRAVSKMAAVTKNRIFFQMAKRRFGPSTKMAPTAELSLTQDPMGNSHKNILLRNHWANLNQTLLNDPWMVPFQIVSGISDLRPRWPPQPNLI